MLSAKWRPCCLGLNVLTLLCLYMQAGTSSEQEASSATAGKSEKPEEMQLPPKKDVSIEWLGHPAACLCNQYTVTRAAFD